MRVRVCVAQDGDSEHCYMPCKQTNMVRTACTVELAQAALHFLSDL